MHPPTPPLLSTESLTVHHAGVVANDDVSITVEAGEIVGLIGPNGAGKTTFVDAVTGFTASTGSVLLDGQCLDGLSPRRRRKLGLSRSWQSNELFGDLTVEHNLSVVTRRTGLWILFRQALLPQKGTDVKAAAALELLGLSELAQSRPPELTLVEQRLVGVARAMVGGPRMVLLDEPAAGLDSRESASFGRRLRRIAGAGPGALLIDHDLTLVLETCDRVYVMDSGVIIATGTPEEIRDDEAVIDAYLGRPTDE